MSRKNWILAKISKKFVKNSILILVVLALIWQFAIPKFTSLAAALREEVTPQADEEILSSPIDELGKPSRVITVPVTAYNSLPGQTDNTPCITANGFDLCENNTQNVIAANFLPFGTKVRFPDYDPETIYTVQDRMNKRYSYRADIWMQSHQDAVNFGLQHLTMEIYQ